MQGQGKEYIISDDKDKIRIRVWNHLNVTRKVIQEQITELSISLAAVLNKRNLVGRSQSDKQAPHLKSNFCRESNRMICWFKVYDSLVNLKLCVQNIHEKLNFC